MIPGSMLQRRGKTEYNHIHTVYDHNNNNVCQASASSKEITNIKPVFLIHSETWNVELSYFAIKYTFNI